MNSQLKNQKLFYALDNKVDYILKNSDNRSVKNVIKALRRITEGTASIIDEDLAFYSNTYRNSRMLQVWHRLDNSPNL